VNYFSPALRECSRAATRLLKGWQLQLARKHLVKVETELGWLGWQQAEYDTPTQREVDKIKNFEREQARLTNESADLAQALVVLTAERAEMRRIFEEKRGALETQCQTGRTAVARLEGEIAELRVTIADAQIRLPQLDRESREVARLHQDLLTVENQTPEMRDELIRLRERTTAITHETADAQAKFGRAARSAEALQKTLTEEEERLATSERELRELEDAHAERDRQLASQLKTKEREKARLEKEVDLLEHEKANPYQQIGRVLADNDIAPMNQPNALAAVREARLHVRKLEGEIASSRAASAAEDRTLLRHSILLWVAIALALTLIAAALVPRKATRLRHIELPPINAE
jgi:chromosome segregation ATPase